MRLLYVVLSFLCCLGLVSANAVITTIPSHEDIELLNHSFRFSHVEDQNKTLVQTPHGPSLVIKGLTCEHNNIVSVCIRQVVTNYSTSKFDPNTYKLDVNVSAVRPQLEFDVTLERTNFTQGSSGQVTLALENTENRHVGNASVVLSLPGFIPFNAVGCTSNQTHLVFAEQMTPNSKFTCTFSLLGANDTILDTSFDAQLKNELFTHRYEHPVHLRVVTPRIAVYKNAPSHMMEGSLFWVNYTLRNKGIEPAIIQADVTFPPSLEVVLSSLNVSGQHVFGAIEIDAKKTQTVSVLVQATVPETAIVDEQFEFGNEQILLQTHLDITPHQGEVTILSLPSPYVQNATGIVSIVVFNPHAQEWLPVNGTLELDGSLSVLNQTFVAPRQNVTTHLHTFIVPFHNVTGMLEITAGKVTTAHPLLFEATPQKSTSNLSALLDQATVNQTQAVRFDQRKPESVSNSVKRGVSVYKTDDFGVVSGGPTKKGDWRTDGIPFYPTILYIVGAIAVIVIASLAYIKRKGKEREETRFEIDQYRYIEGKEE